ncbi:DUF1697 domain-containing protein [Adhaeribacter radiodurans]|uniref:DUF1697 domain-containing protein n=1 Tax=Adhaeribacter radiodurans TaxID=2745197 RepID=A0A7L7LDU2_9BACT|nr:DUF1697 domain-containing protein [Adhaeribacter radiodurans]QMU30927.1 DUF1697 domain-containing protein [Adhaeribacter radiodurans]
MQTYIALLRGINVSGQKMMKMPELLALFQSLNLKNVKTYVQSGNVVFQTEKQGATNLEEQIARAITEKFQFSVPVLVKDQTEWERVLQNNPFIINQDEDTSKLHVTLLASEPTPDRVAKINPALYLPDEFRIVKNTIYLSCPNGYGRTKLHNNFFESKLKVNATTRNWKTMQALMNLVESINS